MKLMVAFLCACFLIGLVLAGRGPGRKTWLLFGICLFVCFAYYFLGQI